MRQRSAPATYNEPTLMWRMRHPRCGQAHAVIIPIKHQESAVWCIINFAQGARDFEEWREAILWLNAVCLELEADGWQVVEDRQHRNPA